MKLKMMKSQTVLRLIVLGLALQVTDVALAANPSSRARERASDNARFNRENRRETRSDDQFIQQAYAQGALELKLAHAAVENSKDTNVVTIGHRIINEQTRAMQDLEKLASSKGLTVNKDLSSADQATFDRLAKLQGADFDKAYRDHLQNDYKRTIQLYQDAAVDARDAGVRDVAAQYATTFEDHAQVIGITGLGTTESRDRSYVRGADRAQTSATGPLTQKDQQFLAQAHRASRTEMEAARLAVKNSRDRQVQALAQRILTDHKDMQQELKDLSDTRNATLPRQLGEGQQSLIKRLGDLSGNEFDREYSQYLVQSHKNALDLFEQGAQSSDPDVRRFATKYRDSIRDHLQSAQQTGVGTKK